MQGAKDQNSEKRINRVHPRQNSNILSKLFYCWALPIFIEGTKKDFTEEDLYSPLKPHLSHVLGDKLEEAWNYETKFRKKPSLWRVLFKVHGKELFLSAIYFSITEYILKLSQPIFLSKLLRYYEPNQNDVTRGDAYLNAALICVLWIAVVIVSHSYLLYLLQLGIKIRVSCSSLVYRKALRLSKSAIGETTIGQMVNLLAGDLTRLERGLLGVHPLWSTPVELVVVLVLIYFNLGYTALVGVAFLFASIPVETYLGKKIMMIRKKIVTLTDTRIRLMTEIINAMRVIKMYAWEKPFSKIIGDARKLEMKQIQKIKIVHLVLHLFQSFVNRIAIFLCVLVHVLTENTPNAGYIFVVASFYGLLRSVMHFPLSVAMAAEVKVAVSRLQTFLMKDEKFVEQNKNELSNLTNGIELLNGQRRLNDEKLHKELVQVSLRNITAKYDSKETNNTLENVNFDVKHNELVAVVGPVGCGKSSLLQIILKELIPESGDVNIRGIVSYTSQEPWIFDGSIRQNILFGEEYKPDKYKEVIRSCALERDLKLFPFGDRTIAGERGVMLSGGQKARISLARAIYKEADIYLLDDPLSAVDTHVGKQLFDNCIFNYLREKCTILITHQLQYLKSVDKIFVMKEGKISSSGTFNDLLSKGNNFANFLSDNDFHGHSNEISKMEKFDLELDGKNSDPVKTNEEKSTGRVKGKIYTTYFRSGGSILKLSILLSMFLMTQLISSGCDYFLAFWVNLQQALQEASTFKIKNETAPEISVTYNSSQFTDDDSFHKTNETNSWKNSKNSSNAYNGDNTVYLFFSSQEHCLAVYGSLILLIVAVSFYRSLIFYKSCVEASVNLHNNMFNNIVKATLQFFNKNSSGRIINRFSKDIGNIDAHLPNTISDTIQIALAVLGASILVGSINPWIFLLTVIMLAIFYGMRAVFLASSRDIKRIEGMTRSPVYAHLSASLRGLSTIRALGAQQILIQEYDKHQDHNTSAFYLFISVNRAFGFYLDFCCSIYNTIVISSIVMMKDEMYGGNVGLAITQSMSLMGMFQWGIRQWSELENQMTSVERVLEYTDIPAESNKKFKDPPKDWPEYGNIRFRKVYLKYNEEDPYVLKNLNFVIQENEKVGIVGRTGAGKTSLLAVLFRLINFEGNIFLDEVNTKDLDLETLRSKLSVIPQEPVLFTGTLRKNLDPFENYNDEILWNVLQDVELKTAVSDLAGGLDTLMSEDGSNFSVGQRQLLCLARAILSSNKILILDEATANIDPQTDSLIQRTIRRKFRNCTVLTIAHRIHTIIDSDKLLVMDAGELVEFGHPHMLLQNKNGIFYGLVEQTGNAMKRNLKNLAAMAYSINDNSLK